MVRQNQNLIGFQNSFMNSANIKQHVQHKQQMNQRNQRQNSRQFNKGQDMTQFNNAVRELCSMYDAVNYFGNADYAKKNGWRVINKEQLNTATIYAIRYAPVVPKRSVSKKQQGKQQQQKPQQQSKQQSRQQPRQQSNKRQSGKRIGGCQYKPNVPRVYSFNTTPLPTSLYPEVNNFNHLYDAFTYFGNANVRNIKSWIESSRTHKLNSIASVFAKRNAPYVPVRQNRSNKRSQPQQQKRSQQQKRPQQQQQQRIVPKQQSNKRQRNNSMKKNKRPMINQKENLSNVWEEYYSSPRHSMFK